MKLFLKYLQGNRKVITLFIMFSIIFALVFLMYHLPMKAVIYPVLLCMLVGIIYFIIDFTLNKRKYILLDKTSRLSADMIKDLPQAENMVEESYQAIINAIQAEITDFKSESTSKYNDMIDYYTIWVHQIKTPIASMRLHLQNMDTDESRKLRGDLFRIEQYADMVLAFLRLDSTSSDYVFKEYILDNVIKQTVKKFSNEFIGRKISLQYEPIELKLVTDEKWLSFVLEQLISNALKYTREGSVKIFMTESETLCIEDTGIGITPEDLPRIFEKGYTGYNGRTDKKASGIGLFLCKRVCDNLGIAIRAESEIGKGTVIKLDLRQNDT